MFLHASWMYQAYNTCSTRHAILIVILGVRSRPYLLFKLHFPVHFLLYIYAFCIGYVNSTHQTDGLTTLLCTLILCMCLIGAAHATCNISPSNLILSLILVDSHMHKLAFVHVHTFIIYVQHKLQTGNETQSLYKCGW